MRHFKKPYGRRAHEKLLFSFSCLYKIRINAVVKKIILPEEKLEISPLAEIIRWKRAIHSFWSSQLTSVAPQKD